MHRSDTLYILSIYRSDTLCILSMHRSDTLYILSIYRSDTLCIRQYVTIHILSVFSVLFVQIQLALELNFLQ